MVKKKYVERLKEQKEVYRRFFLMSIFIQIDWQSWSHITYSSYLLKQKRKVGRLLIRRLAKQAFRCTFVQVLRIFDTPQSWRVLCTEVCRRGYRNLATSHRAFLYNELFCITKPNYIRTPVSAEFAVNHNFYSNIRYISSVRFFRTAAQRIQSERVSEREG